MQKKRKNPCDICRRDLCLDRHCPRWQRWFKENWNKTVARLREEAWQLQDSIGRQRHPTKFVYRLPSELKDPCECCPCVEWCDKPCSLRLEWWNHRVGIVRRNLTGGGRK